MQPLGTLFLVLGCILIGAGILFHYKNKKNYGEYFFFAGVCLFVGILYS
jgi:LPXTG-motif cell wall-anchored protein